MKLGIDFGTTRIVVAAADRGNYPLVPFETADSTFEWFPPLVALRGGAGGERLYGWDAWHAQADSSWTVIRSLKRYLEDAGPETLLEAGGDYPAVEQTPAIIVDAIQEILRRVRRVHTRIDETDQVAQHVIAENHVDLLAPLRPCVRAVGYLRRRCSPQRRRGDPRAPVTR